MGVPLVNIVWTNRTLTNQIATIRANWDAVCDESGLSPVDRAYLWGRQFLSEYALEGYGQG